MTPLVINLIQVSLIMSVVALGLHLITTAFSNSIPPKWKYYMWGIVLISFLLPFRPQLLGPLATIDAPASGNISDSVGNGSVTQNTGGAGDAEGSFTSFWSQADWPTILISIWITGIVVFLAVVLFKHLRFMRTAKRWGEKLDSGETSDLVNSIMEEMSISTSIDTVRSKMVSVPMMAGVFKPVLFLPDYDLDDDELKYVIRHELIHYRKFDIFIKFMGVLANAVHWFNPLVYLMQKWIHTDCEMACDYEVTQSFEEEEKIQYLETIIGVAKHEARYRTVFSNNFYSGKNIMKKRLESVLTTHKVRAALVVAVMAILVIFSIGAGSALGVNFTQGEQTPANQEKTVTDEAISQNETASSGAVQPNEDQTLNSGDNTDKESSDKNSATSNTKSKDSTSTGLIGASKAKSIALSKVGGGTVTECELDKDDGVKKYEIKIVWKGYEYEVDVDAYNGSILKYEKEKEDHDDDHDDD